ncbi:MAG: sialidase family protein, partial [Lentisphaeria bacterium]|nr:sialidase family protein [Lentisphaeria bacterium]
MTHHSRSPLPATLCLGGLLVACSLPAQNPGPWRSHEVYQPRIERATVADPERHGLPYNHDSAVAWFGDRWFCLWNANTAPKEGAPGQLNYVSTSRDGLAWTDPEPAFSSPARAANPVQCVRGTQWQPCLIRVGDELWAFWAQHNGQGRNEPAGVFLSRLADPAGKWQNRLLTFAAGPWTMIGDREFTLFPTQNPYRLRSGRILVPVTMTHRQRSPDASDLLHERSRWTAFEKRDSVLYSDDLGETWQVSPGTFFPGQSFAQWEPTVWEQSDGSVLMFGRTEHVLPPHQGGPGLAQWLRRAVSRDGGATWSPYEHVPIETVRARMHVFPRDGLGTWADAPAGADFGDRLLLMAHNDWQGRSAGGMNDRRNLALFFKRGDGVEFTAGLGFTGQRHEVAYPMAALHEDTLLVSYSHGPEAQRRIEVARITPAPDPARRYLLPRGNTDPPTRPEREGGALLFQRNQFAASARPVRVGADGFSFAAWVRPAAAGVLLDCRDGAKSGFVVGLQGLQPFFFLNPAIGNQVFPLNLEPGRWNYLGLTVDNRTGQALAVVNDQTAERTFPAPSGTPLDGTTAHLGHRRFPASQLTGLDGALRFLAVLPGPSLAAADHQALRAAFATERPQPPPDAALWLDPADEPAFARDFRLPDTPAAGVETAVFADRACLVFRGDASAGLDLDANQRSLGHTVEVEFRFALLAGSEQVVATVGDAVAPARIVHREDGLFLELGELRAFLGTLPAALPETPWHTLRLRTGDGETAVRLDAAAEAVLPHQPRGNWVYLGQGYRHGG